MKKFTTKFLIVLFLTSFIYSFTPTKTNAIYGVADIVLDPSNLVQNTTSAIANPITAAMTTLEKVKHYVLDPLAWTLAKKIVQGLTAQTVNWINSGFQGNPGYVQDPGKFFLNIADNQVSSFLSGPELSKLCTPFQAKIKLALVQNYIQTNQENYSCTLSILKNNYEAFAQDFTQGGWDAWLEVTQNPQNNPIGAYYAAQSEMQQRAAAAQAKVEKQLDQGHGFLSYEKCPEGEELDPALGTGDCKVEKVTVTPGSVIESNLEKALGSGIEQLNLADSFNEIVSALVTQLFKKIVGGSGNGGLYGAKGTITVPDIPPAGVPYLRILGDNPYRLEVDADWRDPGAVAIDEKDGDISDNIVVTGTVNSKVPGTYNITYSVANSAGVAVNAVRVVIVGSYLTGGGGGGGGGGGTCDAGPHPDQSGVVAAAISQFGGLDPNSPNFECDRVSVLEIAVPNIAGGSLVPKNPPATNCRGYSPDTIAFADGYSYDVITGSGQASWSVNGCPNPGGGGGGGGGGATNLQSQLQTERNNYPASLSSLCTNPGGLEPAGCPLGIILNTVAWNNRADGWGLSGKTSGHRCPSPAGEIACDILQHNPSNSIYDVFIDAENAATVTWGGPNPPPGRPFVAPAQP